MKLIRRRAAPPVLDLEEYVQRLVDEAPPLTELQRARLAALLGESPRPEAAKAA